MKYWLALGGSREVLVSVSGSGSHIYPICESLGKKIQNNYYLVQKNVFTPYLFSDLFLNNLNIHDFYVHE